MTEWEADLLGSKNVPMQPQTLHHQTLADHQETVTSYHVTQKSPPVVFADAQANFEKEHQGDDCPWKDDQGKEAYFSH